MHVTLQRPSLEERSFDLTRGDLILILRERQSSPIVGIFQGLYSQHIERMVGRGHERKRLLLQPALTLDPCASIYGKVVPRIKFQENLSFGLGTEIAELYIGKERVLTYLREREDRAYYAELFSHLPDQAPYDPQQFLY